MRGRPPVPTALKILRGNPGHRSLNYAEPKPAPTTDEPPTHLNLGPAALAMWQRHAPELVRLGGITAIDKDEFGLACYLRAWGLEHLDDTPTHALTALRQSSSICARYGIGWTDRSRIAPTAPPQPESKWGGLLRGTT